MKYGLYNFQAYAFLLMSIMVAGCATKPPAIRHGNEPAVMRARVEPSRTSGSHSAGHQILWYIPNRVIDMVDIFRFRVRVGPGLSGNLRVTNLANIYGGRYHTAFIGLPGPRMGPELRYPAGLEQERGLLFMGVDATDDLLYEPGYSPTECVVGAQLLCTGVEFGVDPVELGDFFCGFVLVDPRRDDK